MEEKKQEVGGGEKKIMMLLVATNVVASWLPECWPTGAPTPRANLMGLLCEGDLFPMVLKIQYLQCDQGSDKDGWNSE